MRVRNVTEVSFKHSVHILASAVTVDRRAQLSPCARQQQLDEAPWLDESELPERARRQSRLSTTMILFQHAGFVAAVAAHMRVCLMEDPRRLQLRAAATGLWTPSMPPLLTAWNQPACPSTSSSAAVTSRLDRGASLNDDRNNFVLTETYCTLHFDDFLR